MKNITAKIGYIFFCIFFLSLNACKNSTQPAPPPPELDPLYQLLNSESHAGSIPRPPSMAIMQQDPAAAPSSAPDFMAATPSGFGSQPVPVIPADVEPVAPISVTTAPYIDPYSNVAPKAPPPPQYPILPPAPKIPQSHPPKQEEPDFDFSQVGCNVEEEGFKEILAEVKKRKFNVIKTLPACLKLNRSLMMRAAIIHPSEFQYAADILKEDESFVYRMIEINPEILKFASPSLRSDSYFMERATYLNRDSLQYANPKLLNNKIFIRNMIKIDSENYIFASERLKEIPEFAGTAFKDNGLLLQYAPNTIKDDKKLVTIAVKSNADALIYASDILKEDKALKRLALKKTSIESEDKLKEFLSENYLNDSDKKNVGIIIDHRMKYFAKNKMVDRNYVTKWQRSFDPKNENMRLIAADSRNFPVSWKDDFRRFPVLIKKIENFLLNRQVDQNTINSLSTVYFWKVKKNPQTVVFNLYLLRDSKDVELGPKFGNVTSLTAIAQRHGQEWDLSVVEVIFDSEMRIDVAYENGHKKFALWDLHEVDKKDLNPKIIFKVEDKFKEYFEIFEEQNNGKYRLIYRIDSLKDAMNEVEKPVFDKNKDDSF